MSNSSTKCLFHLLTSPPPPFSIPGAGGVLGARGDCGAGAADDGARARLPGRPHRSQSSLAERRHRLRLRQPPQRPLALHLGLDLAPHAARRARTPGGAVESLDAAALLPASAELL